MQSKLPRSINFLVNNGYMKYLTSVHFEYTIIISLWVTIGDFLMAVSYAGLVYFFSMKLFDVGG